MRPRYGGAAFGRGHTMLAKGPPPSAGPAHNAYTLVEELGDGSHLREVFHAPSNSEAIARARDVIEGGKAELWRGPQLICSWDPPGAPT